MRAIYHVFVIVVAPVELGEVIKPFNVTTHGVSVIIDGPGIVYILIMVVVIFLGFVVIVIFALLEPSASHVKGIFITLGF